MWYYFIENKGDGSWQKEPDIEIPCFKVRRHENKVGL
jgi:hypothetical protein